MPCARRSGEVAKRSSPSSCTSRAEQLGRRAPGLPVVLAERILDRDERVATRPARDLARQRGAVQAALLARQPVAVAVDELRGRDVERQRGLDARALDAAGRDLERLLVGGERRGQAALVGHERGRRGRARAARPRCRARTRAACSMASANVRRSERDHEHVLHVDRAPRVRAAREHVDHRQRQQRREVGGEQPPERRARGLGGGQRAGDRRRQHGIGAEPRERGRAVEVAQGGVDRAPGRPRRARAAAPRSRR